MPKVSVIVPNYNHAPFLRQRIESILNQTYQDFELILLDDCSTDNSREIIAEYARHPKVSHVDFSDKNSGSPFIQWSKGIALAAGEYVWIAESDDWAEPKLLETLCRMLDNNPKAGLAYCNSFLYVNNQLCGDSSTWKNKKFTTTKWQADYYIDGKSEINNYFLLDCTINNVSSVLFRKTALTEIFPLQHPFVYSGDWFCYIRVASGWDIAYTAYTLNNYRDHAANTSKKAGFNYMIELFYIYDWLWKNYHAIDKRRIQQAFFACTSDINGAETWKIKRDYITLKPINKTLYWKHTIKQTRRALRKWWLKLRNTNKLS